MKTKYRPELPEPFLMALTKLEHTVIQALLEQAQNDMLRVGTAKKDVEALELSVFCGHMAKQLGDMNREVPVQDAPIQAPGTGGQALLPAVPGRPRSSAPVRSANWQEQDRRGRRRGPQSQSGG